MQLDARLARQEIAGWEKGKTIFLISNGVSLVGPKGKRLYYRPDFIVTHLDGRRELVDVKGWQGGDSYARYWLKKEILRSMRIEVTEVS